MDVTRWADCERTVQEAVREFGGLDHGVNAAAIENETQPLADCEEDTYDRMLAVNLRSVFLCMKYEIRAMRAQGRGGTVVNIASTNSFRPQPHQAAYTASKHGVLGLVRSAAAELARTGVTVNAVCPAYVDTPMTDVTVQSIASITGRTAQDARLALERKQPIGRLIRPDEVADAVWFCVENEAVTGQAINVDGGAVQ